MNALWVMQATGPEISAKFKTLSCVLKDCCNAFPNIHNSSGVACVPVLESTTGASLGNFIFKNWSISILMVTNKCIFCGSVALNE